MGVGLFILGLLKYILIALLCVIIFFIALAAFIVLMPIRYRGQLSYEGKLTINVRATWIFKIFTVIYSNSAESGAFKLFIFGRDFFNRGKKKKKKKKIKKQPDRKDINKEKLDDECVIAEDIIEEDIIEEDIIEEDIIEEDIIEEDINIDKEINIKRIKKEETEQYTYKDEANNKTGIIDRIKELRDKVKSILDYPDKKLIVQATIKLMRKLFSALKPKRIKLEAEIGFDDPSATGRAIGALAFFSGVNGIDLTLQGDFDKPVVNIAADIRGRFIIWEFLWPLIRYVLNKPIWKIVKRIIFRKDEEDEQS